MGSTLEFRKAFVKRLTQACEESDYVPPPHKGRQQYLADKLGVAPEAVSKWWVIDRTVHETYFTHMREVGLAALKSTLGTGR